MFFFLSCKATDVKSRWKLCRWNGKVDEVICRSPSHNVKWKTKCTGNLYSAIDRSGIHKQTEHYWFSPVYIHKYTLQSTIISTIHIWIEHTLEANRARFNGVFIGNPLERSLYRLGLSNYFFSLTHIYWHEENHVENPQSKQTNGIHAYILCMAMECIQGIGVYIQGIL